MKPADPSGRDRVYNRQYEKPKRKFCEIMSLSTGTWRLSLACMVCGLLLGASTTCFASSITYVGSDVDLGSGWRTSTVLKDDIDGNNVLGSDGWYVAGGSGSQMLPAYITSLVPNSSVYPGNGGYFSIDNPLTMPGPSPSTIVSGTLNPFPGTGNATIDLSFTFGANVPAIVRLGLMIDNLDIAGYNPSALQVVQNGGPAASTVVDTTGTLFNDRIPDWLYFDIQAQPGATYDVLVSGGPNGCACLGAASFDSVSDVPEPSSFELAGLGAALLAIGSLLGGRVVRRFA
jgi:hypothetical protein